MHCDGARLAFNTALSLPLLQNRVTWGYVISLVVKHLADAAGATKSATAGFSLMEGNLPLVDCHVRLIEWLRA